jgi:hypothetical protein
MDNINNIAGTHNSAVDILLFAKLFSTGRMNAFAYKDTFVNS